MKIEFQNVSKTLGRSTILDEITMSLGGDGTIIALLGANGAGKTTFLHLLGGLYQPSSGEILIDGERLSRRRLDQRSRLHYLPDIPAINPRQTPIEYVLYACEAYQLEREVDDRIVSLFETFDLLSIADCPSNALSRGQCYKATLCALLAVDPELWIMDEPFTSGMDPAGLNAMRSEMRQAKDRGRTVIFSTQLVEVAQGIADQVCLLNDSKVAAFGTLQSLRASSDEDSPALRALLEDLREGSA